MSHREEEHQALKETYGLDSQEADLVQMMPWLEEDLTPLDMALATADQT